MNTFKQLIKPSGRLDYLEQGDGRTVLAVHGDASNLPLLSYQANTLKDSCHFSAFAPNWNAPEMMGLQSSFECETNLIEDYLDSKGLDKVTLIGTDRGVGMALAFASRYPERIEKLILSNCLANPDNSDWENEDEFPNTSPDCNEQMGNMHARIYSQDAANIENGLRKLTMPVLVVWCKGNIRFDFLWYEWITYAIPKRVKKIVLQFDTTLSPLESAQQYTQSIRQFVISEFSGL